MQTFNIIKKTKISNSFRAQATMASFTMEEGNLENVFCGSLDLDFDWCIGMIVGASGTGKTTIARDLFKDNFIESYNYNSDCVLDDMPSTLCLNDIYKAFTSVGFSSPPDWIKPYNVLSNGQKMRCNLARAILEDRKTIAFDEFSSVIDRESAKVACIAISKFIKNNNRKFVAVCPHKDIEEYLQPDWVFNTDDFTFTKTIKKKDPPSSLVCTRHTKTTESETGSLLQNITI